MRLCIGLFAFVSACIESPTVELVDSPDAAASSTPPPAPTTTTGGPAPAPSCDSTRCEPAGGKCVGDACTFECKGEGACKQPIKCPSGMPCNVSCVGDEACEGTIECLDATSCTIHCSGEHACKQGVICEGQRCAVTCEQKGCSADDVRCCATACTLNGAAATCR
jgi:hypothetical protein